MSKEDYYETLGVSKSASADELKKAYRKKAMQFHPDKNVGDAEAEVKFKQVNEAYEILKDEQKRAAYDQFGHRAFEQGGGGGFGGGAGAGGFDFSSGNFSDIFEDLFGNFGGGAGARSQTGQNSRGSDLRYNLEISLEDAFAGKKQSINYTTSIICDSCDGSGAEAGSEPETCPTCGGRGTIRASQGFFMIEKTCGTCAGTGTIIKNHCKKCSGTGRVSKNKNLSVTIPAGVENGTRIRLSGEGEAGFRGGYSGDLYIFVSVKPHEIFKRDGDQIYFDVPIKLTTATLGGAIEVPTIDGKKVKVSVPEGTQSGKQFRLRGKGMQKINSTRRGDMLINALVETPVNLTKRQKEILKEFEEEGDNVSPESDGFFDKVKSFWEDLKD